MALPEKKEYDDLAGLAGAISSGLEEERAEATSLTAAEEAANAQKYGIPPWNFSPWGYRWDI